MATFSERLRLLRDERGWTQDELADKINVSREAVTGYEAPSKKRIPREPVLKKIAKLFDVNTDFLLGYSDVRKPFAEEEENDSLYEIWQRFVHRKVPDCTDAESEQIAEFLEMKLIKLGIIKRSEK